MVNTTTDHLAEVFHVLGHPMRLAIVKGLLKHGCNVNKIVTGLKLPQSTVSQHLKILKSAGIVRGERKGVMICYRVIDPVVKSLLKISRRK